MESLLMPHALHYTGQPLDRADHLRETDIRALLSGDRLRVLPIWRGRHPVDGAGTPLWRTAPETSEPVFLGRDAGGYTWVTEDISHLPAADRDDNDRGPGRLDGLTADVRWLDLRGFGATLPAGLAATLAYARGMAFWHAGHRFCGPLWRAHRNRAWRACSHLLRQQLRRPQFSTHGSGCYHARDRRRALPAWSSGEMAPGHGFHPCGFRGAG